MKAIFILLMCASVGYASAQKVGINKTNPTEALDVNGNVNISGTLKANGTAGSNGQVLVSTGTGLSWGGTMGYKKCIQYTYSGSFSWTVPAGVTEIMVEIWGGGSGGSGNAGGASGGYARTVQTVAPGSTISGTVGSRGVYGTSSSTSGGTSTVNFASGSVSAYGGGGVYSVDYLSYANSGSYTGTIDNVYIKYGNPGRPNQVTFGQANASTYVQYINYGTGGAAVGMLNAQPIAGDIARLENGGVVYKVYADTPSEPGVGGPAGYINGYSGGPGQVVIWFN